MYVRMKMLEIHALKLQIFKNVWYTTPAIVRNHPTIVWTHPPHTSDTFLFWTFFRKVTPHPYFEKWLLELGNSLYTTKPHGSQSDHYSDLTPTRTHTPAHAQSYIHTIRIHTQCVYVRMYAYISEVEMVSHTRNIQCWTLYVCMCAGRNEWHLPVLVRRRTCIHVYKYTCMLCYART